MILVRSSFHSDSHRFVSFNNTSVCCLVFSNCATSFPARTMFTRHCCWHRNFQLFSSVLPDILKFLVLRFNEVNTTQSSGIIELSFLDSPFCFSLRFVASDICFRISGHNLSGLEVVCFLVSLSPTMKIHPVIFPPICWVVLQLKVASKNTLNTFTRGMRKVSM